VTASGGQPPAAPSAPGRRRLVLLVAAAVAAVALAIAATTILGGPGRHEATGIVVSVEATSLSNVQGFSIRTLDGQTIDFRIGRLENASIFPPGHLAEHKVSLVPIRVTYVERDGAREVVRIEDAR
jgi:hypothetical protein